ncbi:hypothetical protein NJ959_18540, partial [Symplocastrum sp. BBK-W-15]|nr:hypothetical protein [Limnofasciculus baicalensis BBK-W-15]
FCNVEEWTKAVRIVAYRLHTAENKKLHKQLDTWGYYFQQIKLYKNIICSLQPRYQLCLHSGLATSTHPYFTEPCYF